MKLLSAVAISAALARTSAAEAPTGSSNATVASALASSDPFCRNYAKDIDLPGNDLGSAKGSDWAKCWDLCLGRGGCQAWTWTNYEGGTCWLKGGHGQAAYVPGATSGTLTARNGWAQCPAKYLIIPNCDMPGHDTGSWSGRDFTRCEGFADRFGRFFTWTDYLDGMCWLKDSPAPCKYAPNTFSGYRMS